ncbi:bzip transcription factor haca [Gigaspora margarita]|nr:bzip transcription factor haca [Gigaspora margarita]
MSSTAPSTSSSNDYKCSANHVPNTWSEDMVTSDLRTETSISQLLENSPLLYTPTLSSTVTSPDLRDTLEADDDENRIPPTSIFTLQDLINIEELRKLAASSDCMFSRTTNNSTTLPNLAPSITPVKPIAPALFSPISAISSSPSSEVDPSEQRHSSTNNNVTTDEKKKSAGGRKRKAESLEEKEQRQRERILRNRHAAQMSRDKKRRQMADLESQNSILKEENAHLSKRLKVVEEENANLSAKLDSISAQLAEIQSHLAVSEMNKVLLDGVRGSAVSAASEKETLDFSNIKDIPINNNGSPDEILPSFINDHSFPRESTSEKSQQRPVKMRNLYGMSSITTPPSFLTWMCPPQMLKQLLLTFSIVFWTTTGHRKNFLLFSNNQMVFVDDIVISELLRRFDEKRWSKSVKAVRGCSSGLKRAPRDWRKYPP